MGNVCVPIPIMGGLGNSPLPHKGRARIMGVGAGAGAFIGMGVWLYKMGVASVHTRPYGASPHLLVKG